MSNKDLTKLHLAIQEQRYRDAREIIENGDLDSRTARKWRRWLSEYYREEWKLAGIESSKRTPVRVSKYWHWVGSLTVLLVFGILLNLSFILTFTQKSFDILILLIGGFGVWGWIQLINRLSIPSILIITWGLCLSAFFFSAMGIINSYNPVVIFLFWFSSFTVFIVPGLYFMTFRYGSTVGNALARRWRKLDHIIYIR